MTLQAEEDLRIVNHTLLQGDMSWEKWCRTLPPHKNVHYTLVKKDGTILCDSIDRKREGQGYSGEAILSPELDTESFFAKDLVSASMKAGQDLFIHKQIPISTLRENMDRFDRVLFLRIVPFAFLSYFVFIFLFFRSTKPLGIILSKVEKFKDDIPFNKSLQLLYKRDEWGAIEEALNKADIRLQNQILEVQQENEKNTAILESINDNIIAIDRYESILFYNTKFAKDFIRNREGLEINKKIWHIFDDEVLNAFRSVLKNGEPRSIKATTFPQSKNPDRIFDLTITPLSSSPGVINGALGVFHDVTEFKMAEQMRVDFVANVSHEIRTPLTSIKGFTQILQTQEGKVDPSLHPFLGKIVANTERMISLFNDLLNLSVIESRNDLRREDCSLPDIVDAVEGNIIASYPEKNITFNSELTLEHVKGDFRLIEQVILNLCDNACKYSDDSVAISISGHLHNNKACIRIKDNGPGIAKEHLPRIFERFYRVDASRESLRGTGLGLSIVKQIVSKHKGRIWAESEGPGLGTTFVIELPLE